MDKVGSGMIASRLQKPESKLSLYLEQKTARSVPRRQSMPSKTQESKTNLKDATSTSTKIAAPSRFGFKRPTSQTNKRCSFDSALPQTKCKPSVPPKQPSSAIPEINNNRIRPSSLMKRPNLSSSSAEKGKVIVSIQYNSQRTTHGSSLSSPPRKLSVGNNTTPPPGGSVTPSRLIYKPSPVLKPPSQNRTIRYANVMSLESDLHEVCELSSCVKSRPSLKVSCVSMETHQPMISAARISRAMPLTLLTDLETADMLTIPVETPHVSMTTAVVEEVPGLTRNSCLCAVQYSNTNIQVADKPPIEQIKPMQCITHLAQAQPSSYTKKLLNSFAVEEQLSPTAARCSLVSKGSVIHNPSVIPPAMYMEFLFTDKDGEDEFGMDMQFKSVFNPDAHFKTGRSKSLTVESVDDIFGDVCVYGTCSFDGARRNSGGFLNTFLSKIGSRRILQRPQELPPSLRTNKKSHESRIAKAQSPATNRRKLSPKASRKNINRPTTPEMSFKEQQKTERVLQSSPKHKPDSREDSPIRSKEAFYGGIHHHTMISSTNQKLEEEEAAADGRLHRRAVLTATLISTSQNIPGQALVKDSFQGLIPPPLSFAPPSDVIQRCGTPIPSLDTCHQKYSGSYGMHKENYSYHYSASHQILSSIMDQSSHSKKKRTRSSSSNDGSGDKTLTNFTSLLKIGMPQCPSLPASPVDIGHTALSKVAVAVRCKPIGYTASSSASYITTDTARGQLYLRDPSNESNVAPSCRRQMSALPRLFSFDHVFSAESQQVDVCSKTLWDILQCVMQGSDGCVISYGQSKTGKSHTMIGQDSSCTDFGVIPTTISWLYQLIEQQKTKTGARFSVRISVLEIKGNDEELIDLLANQVKLTEGELNHPPRLVETTVYGAQLENLSEHRAPDAEQAGIYLDRALTQLSQGSGSNTATNSHLLVTLHIYKHQLENKPTASGGLVAGGRSRLHLIDIGSCAKSRADGSALTLASLGSIITSLLDGQKHFSHVKESKLATLLKESVGNAGCKTCMLVSVSSQPSQYMETLQILQLAARIHRMKVRRKNKFSSNSSDGTDSTNSRVRRRRGIRMGTGSASLSDPDFSSSEQSVDTVIYVPPDRQREAFKSPTVYRTKPESSSRQSPSAAVTVPSSPYDIPGAIKMKASDDETSSEGRRRMPRTNARAWPKQHSTESPSHGNNSPNHHYSEITYQQPPPPLPARDQWIISGTSIPANHIQPNIGYYNPHHQPMPHQPVAHQHVDLYQQSQIAAHNQAIPPPWVSLAQYNGQPEELNTWIDGANRQTKPAAPTQQFKPAGATVYPESHKQELWVDGPTAFTRHIDRLTTNLNKDDVISPSRKHANLRHHSVESDVEKLKHHHHHHKTPKKQRERHGSSSRDTPSKHKHCAQCGVDIKKSRIPSSSDIPPSEEDSKHADGQDIHAEPTISIKPFVKDWVMKHSQNNTPNKSSEDKECQGRLTVDEVAQTRMKLLDKELEEQEELQLTIQISEGEDNSNHLVDTALDGDVESQDEVQIDDSVSNVTADDRVGYESKGESVCDENSLAGEMIEVCDAACQTEFTDSETQSLKSLSQSEKMLNSQDSSEIRDEVRSLESKAELRSQDCESYLSTSMQSNLFRKPDGASDPNLHKENNEEKFTGVLQLPDTNPGKDYYSNTLPRSVHLNSYQLNNNNNEVKDPVSESMKPIQLRPYLAKPAAVTSNTTRGSTLPRPATNSSSLIKPPTKLPPSKLKTPAPTQSMINTQQGIDKLETAPSSPNKKKLSKLPGPKTPTKIKEQSKPTTQNSLSVKTNSTSEANKRDKKSLIPPPTSPKKTGKSVEVDNSPLPPPSTLSRFQNFDASLSPYRQYVLPRPSYANSDACSDNSSCTQARTKCSVSSGYESLIADGHDDLSPVNEKKTLKPSSPWLSSLQKNFELKSTRELANAMDKRREGSPELLETLSRSARIDELLYKQDTLKREMTEAKRCLMVPAGSWNFELHVASQIDRRNEVGYLEALEKETSILQKRVDACKARIMLVTSIL